ncbi:MAG: PfkB family carbohydrate kinase [Marmoricola sp.]
MIVVVGESLVDVLPDEAGGEPVERVGGSPLNVAVALGRLDVSCLLITEIADDDRGEAVVEAVTASGCEIVAAPSATGRTATATARLDHQQDATYDFDLTWTLPPQELPACDALHVGSLGTLLDPGRTSVLDLVDQAWARDVAVSYDPNLRPAFVEDRDSTWRDVEALAERCRLVKVSEEDVALLHPGADPGDIARSLLAGERTELVVLTRGRHGATAFAGDLEVTVEPVPVTVVDTVGAGDAFMAGLLTVLLESGALGGYGPGMPADPDRLRVLLGAANQVAALTCAQRGAQPPLRAALPPRWP